MPGFKKGVKKVAKKAESAVKKAVREEVKKAMKDPRKTGMFIGQAVAGAKGAAIGRSVGAIVSKVSGHGDYVIRNNTLSVKGDPGQALKFTPDGRRGIRIREREYIGDITADGALVSGATAFSNRTYPINPGMSTVFPWLSTIANCFDQWEPNGIIFEFRSTSSDFNGSSQALGAVGMATEYDVADPAFTSKTEFDNADYTTSDKSSESFFHAVECAGAERQRKLYSIRSGAVPTGDIARNYDLGNFQLHTKGMSVSGVTVGELWVSYDITFYKKQLFAPFGANIYYATKYGDSGTSNANYFGTVGALTTNIPNFTLLNQGFTFTGLVPGARFAVFMKFQKIGAVAAATALTYTLANCYIVGAGLSLNVNGVAPQTLNSYWFEFQVNGEGTVSVVFAGQPYGPSDTPGASVLEVTQVNNSQV